VRCSHRHFRVRTSCVGDQEPRGRNRTQAERTPHYSRSSVKEKIRRSIDARIWTLEICLSVEKSENARGLTLNKINAPTNELQFASFIIDASHSAQLCAHLLMVLVHPSSSKPYTLSRTRSPTAPYPPTPTTPTRAYARQGTSATL
jgi:hypothetical protein